MLDQVAEKLGSPADAAFEKTEIELRKAAGDTAEEDCLGDSVTGGSKMTDVVVDKVGRR